MSPQGGWHWRFIEEEHPRGIVDEGVRETGHQLRAAAIILKDHDSRLLLIIDSDHT